ncbi:hypothetical protein V6N11_079661 [Hibiscus sabdariffa]|uniref:RNase H type-1 domain-containing protein n=1 Tax=Hibiscus sabdariffa TaxID=183260 RepID=A0ABR2RWR2_9ROSI
MWQITFRAALWSIWLARCEMLFNGKLISVNELLFLSKLRALFWLNVGKEDWNFDLEVWWQNPSSFLSSGLSSAKASWCPLDTEMRQVLYELFSQDQLLIQIRMSQKLLAVKFALELFCETSWFGKVGLLVEVDSQVVLNWFYLPFTRPWRWWPQLIAIDLLTKRIGKVDFSLVDRQCNALAYGLSRDGALRASFFKAW